MIKTKKTKNKEKHSQNGNHNTNITIINWNKGNTKYTNKKDSIEYVLQQQNPDIMTIQELNVTEDMDINLIQVPGYKLELDQLFEKFGRARSGIFIKETIRYERLKNLEAEDEPVIWIQISMAGNKKLKIQNYYRQWRMLDKNGQGIKDTETQKNQNKRFQKVVDIWSTQLEQGEILSLSDTNINLNKNFNNTNEISESERKLIPIYRMLQDKNFNKGATFIKTIPTKIYEKKRTPS